MNIELQFKPIKANELTALAVQYGMPSPQSFFSEEKAAELTETVGIKMMQTYFSMVCPEVQFDSFELQKNKDGLYDCIKVFCQVANYALLFQKLYRLSERIFDKKENVQPLFDTVHIIDTHAPVAFESFFNQLSVEAMDQIIITLVNGYKAPICEQINKALQENKISLTVTGIMIQS